MNSQQSEAGLHGLLERSRRENDLRAWCRATVVFVYLERARNALAPEDNADQSTLARWVANGELPSPCPKLDVAYFERLVRLIEAGPLAAGFKAATWTSRMVTELIRSEFGVTYHWKHVPQLLRHLGFSVR